MSETSLELMHIYAQHLVTETGVLPKHNLLYLWRVDYPLPVGVGDDAEAILLKLGDGEKVCNPALVDPNFKHPEVTNAVLTMP